MLDEFPNKKAMVMDILRLPDSVAHDSSDGVAGWNLGLDDASVAFRLSQKVYDMCVSYRPIGNQWWGFGRARNILEGCEGP